jgi:hypothetical protein
MTMRNHSGISGSALAIATAVRHSVLTRRLSALLVGMALTLTIAFTYAGAHPQRASAMEIVRAGGGYCVYGNDGSLWLCGRP